MYRTAFPVGISANDHTQGANDRSIMIGRVGCDPGRCRNNCLGLRTFGLSYHSQESEMAAEIGKALGRAILVAALFISLMKIRGMYRPIELLVVRNQIRAVCAAWTGVFLLLAGTVFALKIGHEISRGSACSSSCSVSSRWS